MIKVISSLRRLALAGVLIAAAVFSVAAPAMAQDYPNRPIHLIVGFAAGSGADILARFYADKVSKATGQTVVVENRPGANGNIAAEAVTRSKPDGYTLLFAPSAAISGGRFLYKNMPYDSQKDFIVVAPLLDVAFVLGVGVASPAKSVGELTALLKSKSNPRYATSNSTSIAAAQLYMTLAGFKAQQIPYRTTADVIPELSDGTVDFMFLDGVFALSQQKAGKVRLLATTSSRIAGAPDVPTMAEAGVGGYGFTVWWMITAPAGTPASVVDKLNGIFANIAKEEGTKSFLANSASVPLTSTPKEAADKLAKDIETWGAIARAGNIQPQ